MSPRASIFQVFFNRFFVDGFHFSCASAVADTQLRCALDNQNQKFAGPLANGVSGYAVLVSCLLIFFDSGRSWGHLDPASAGVAPASRWFAERRTPQDAPKASQETLQTRPRRPKRLPRCPRRLQDAPKKPQEAAKTAPRRDFSAFWEALWGQVGSRIASCAIFDSRLKYYYCSNRQPLHVL